MPSANPERRQSPEGEKWKPEAAKTPEHAEREELHIPEVGETLKIYDASGNEQSEVVVGADKKEGIVIVGHETSGAPRVREIMPGESNSRERAEEMNEKLNKAFEAAVDATIKAFGLKGKEAKNTRAKLGEHRALIVAKAASMDAPEAALMGSVEALTHEKKETKEAEKKARMERGVQETRLEVLSKREEVVRLRAEIQQAEKTENEAVYKKARRAFDKASKSLHLQERALVQLESYLRPEEPKEEIVDEVEGTVELKPKPVYSEGVTDVENAIDFSETRMRDLDKVLQKDPKNVTALNEWNLLNHERTADRVVLESLKRKEDKERKEKKIEALRAETEAMDKKELAEAKKEMKTAEKAKDDKKAEQLLAKIHELENPAEDTKEIKALKAEIAEIDAKEARLAEADWEGFNVISKSGEAPAPEAPYLDEEVLSQPPPVPEEIKADSLAEDEARQKEKTLRGILENIQGNRRGPQLKPAEPIKEEELEIDTSEFEKKPEARKKEGPIPEEEPAPGSRAEKNDVRKVVANVAEQRLKKEEEAHQKMLLEASKGLDIPASKIEIAMAAFKNARLWERFRTAEDKIPEKKWPAKLNPFKKEKSERQKIWGEIQAAAKEAGIDLTKAGKKRAR